MNNCTICGSSLEKAIVIVGTGNGSGDDFAHEWCYKVNFKLLRLEMLVYALGMDSSFEGENAGICPGKYLPMGAKSFDGMLDDLKKDINK